MYTIVLVLEVEEIKLILTAFDCIILVAQLESGALILIEIWRFLAIRERGVKMYYLF